MGYDLDGQSSIPGGGKPIFITPVQIGPGGTPASYAMGTLSSGVKRPGRESDYSPSSSAEVKILRHTHHMSAWRGA
jgi:hypothetical protein